MSFACLSPAGGMLFGVSGLLLLLLLLITEKPHVPLSVATRFAGAGGGGARGGRGTVRLINDPTLFPCTPASRHLPSLPPLPSGATLTGSHPPSLPLIFGCLFAPHLPDRTCPPHLSSPAHTRPRLPAAPHTWSLCPARTLTSSACTWPART